MSDSLLTSLHKVLDKPHSLTPPVQPNLFDQKDEFNSFEDYYSYGGYGRRGYSLTKPAYTTTPTVTRRILVLGPNGSEQPYTVPYDCIGWFDIAKEIWPTTNDTMRVPLEHCEFSYGEPRFNACVYTAANDYMQARWGRKLDDSDRRWLASHPLSTDNGVPQEYTATCVDQLVEPYGMRVSRVRLRKGSLVLGDSIMAWIQALGCNPFALADRSTTNAEAAERMGITVEQANALWRVEFHDDALPCSIVGERGWTNTTGVKTGSFGGHARYLAPRGHAGDWFISVQLDMDTQVTHLVPSPSPEYVPRKGESTLLLGAITGPDGKRIAERINTKWVPFGTTPEPEPPKTVVVETPKPTLTEMFQNDWNPATTRVEQIDQASCLFCGDTTLTTMDVMVEADVCFHCLEEAWSGYQCPHCKVAFDKAGAPYPVAFDEKTYDWECPSCKGTVTVGVEDDPVNQQDYTLQEICFTVFRNMLYDQLEQPESVTDDDNLLFYE